MTLYTTVNWCALFGNSSPMSEKGAPNLSDRQKCYAARDAFYECLTKHAESKGDAPSNHCDKLKEVYHSSCRPAWVKYFDKKQVYDAYKKQLEEKGYQPLPVEDDVPKR